MPCGPWVLHLKFESKLLLNVRKRMGPHGIGKIYGQAARHQPFRRGSLGVLRPRAGPADVFRAHRHQ
ncbi:hypothetical protein AP071_15755, partial [Rhodobacter capsulatus]